jgi:hypothetical protein
MEIERCELEVVAKRKCAILDKVTLLEKGIKISNPKRFMWIQTKQNNVKHVEHMEN